MYLSKPVFPISFNSDDIEDFIDSFVKKRHWNSFEIKSEKLVYVPFYLFVFESFSESEGKQKNAKIVSGSQSGSMALNALTSELVEDSSELSNEELSNKPTENYAFEIQKPKIQEKDAEKIAVIKLSSKMGVPCENIIISSIELAYLPVWFVAIECGKKEFIFKINACTGKTVNEIDIPERNRGFGEIADETIYELKKPSAWAKYSSEIASDTVSWVSKNPAILPSAKNLFSDPQTIVIILAITAIIAVLWASGVF
jgi:hypothetical protein